MKNWIYNKNIISVIVLFFAFSLPLSRAAVSFFIVFLPILWLIEGDYQNKVRKLKESRFVILFFAFLFLLFISLSWTSNPLDAKRELRLLLYYGVLVVIATSFSIKYFQKVIDSFLFGLFISELITYGVYFGFWHLKHATHEFPNPFMGHIDYSVFLAFGATVLLYRILSKWYSIKEKIPFILFFITITGNLFISGGRTGQLAYVFGLITLSFLHYRFKLKSVIISFILIFGIFGTAYLLSPNFQKRIESGKQDIQKILAHNNYTSSWGIRVAYLMVGEKILKENPIFGVGIGGYKNAIKEELQKPQYNHGFAKEFMMHHTPHNQYMLILIELGIVGFLLFLTSMYSFFRLPIQDKNIKDISILFGVVFFTSFIADTFLLDQFTLALFCLFVGMFVSISLSQKKRI